MTKKKASKKKVAAKKAKTTANQTPAATTTVAPDPTTTPAPSEPATTPAPAPKKTAAKSIEGATAFYAPQSCKGVPVGATKCVRKHSNPNDWVWMVIANNDDEIPQGDEWSSDVYAIKN